MTDIIKRINMLIGEGIFGLTDAQKKRKKKLEYDIRDIDKEIKELKDEMSTTERNTERYQKLAKAIRQYLEWKDLKQNQIKHLK